MSKFKKLLSVIVMAVVAVSCFTAYGVINAKASGTSSSVDDYLVYQLDFADSANRMDNKAGNGIADATLTTDGTNATFTENAINGKTALNLTKAGSQKNYVTIPGEVVNHDSVTITAWVKQSKDIAQWTRPFSIFTDASHRMEIMPNAQQGLLNVSLLTGSALTYQGNDSITVSSVRETDSSNWYSSKGNLTSVYGAWAHYAYEFTPTDFNYYVNGELYFTVNTNELKDNGSKGSSLSLKGLYDASKNTRLVIGATLCDSTVDYTGSFADVRVYNKALSSAELKEIAGYKDYKDHLIASYDFEDGAKDSVGGFDGTLVNTAKIEDGKLVLDGNGVGINASQMLIPSTVVESHKKITVSLDILVNSATANYTRVFEFAPSWQEQLILALKWNHGGATYVGKMVAKHCLVSTKDVTYTPVNFSTYDRWVNLVFTTDGETFSVYADGICLTTGAMKYQPNIFNYKGVHATVASFGGSPKSTSDKGTTCSMDNIKIYNTALTAEEVAAEYEANHPKEEVLWLDAVLSDVSLESGSYLSELADVNAEYLMFLDKEKVLYNHRLVAGLDTKGATSYDGWEASNRGLSGQFASNYLAALARASASNPNYTYNGETIMQRLTYLVTEFKKCQDAYAKINPADAGYWGGLHMNQYDGLARIDANGNYSEGGYMGYGKTHDTTFPNGTRITVNVWVPWRVAHDNIKALYDVAIYAGSAELRAIGKEMMYKYADWVYNRLYRYNATQRADVVRLEYGGMAEALWNIAYVAQQDGLVEKAGQYAFCAQTFTQKNLVDDWYKNIDTLSIGNEGQTTGKHANTAVPKMFACVAAYEVTGDEYYLTAAKNAFDMVAGRLYAFGGTSRLENWVDECGKVQTAKDSAETCTTMNMLKLADYLFRWTGDVKYADFYELAFTNHILTSMDPDSAGKTYFVTTEFGGHKLYHDKTGHFWCCTSTGLESFAKLNYGIYYVNADGDVTVNTFYGSTYKVSDNVTLTQTGDFYNSQSTKITVSGSGTFAIRLRVPDWAKSGFTVKVNGVEKTVAVNNGYIEIDRTWSNGDYIDYTVPFDVWFQNLNDSTNYKAMMYGPLTMVNAIGDKITDDIRSYTAYPNVYVGAVKQEIQHMGDISNSVTVSSKNGYPIVKLVTDNQGELIFEPFNRVFHYRYGMYFNYTEIPEVSGNEVEYDFGSPADAGSNTGYEVSNGALVNNKDGALLTLTTNNPSAYIVTYTLNFPSSANNTAMHAGAVVLGNFSSGVNGYFVSVERVVGTAASNVRIYKVANGVIGNYLQTASLVCNKVKAVEVKAIVSGTTIMVIAKADSEVKLSLVADSAVSNASVGLYTISGTASFESASVVSSIASSKGLLQNAVDYANNINESLYTTASVAALKSVLATTSQVLSNGSATEENYKQANAQLRTALAALEVLASKDAFNARVQELSALDSSKYTSTSWKALQDQIARMQALDVSDMSQAAFDLEMAALEQAVTALKTKGDRSALDAKIAEAEALNEADYTKTSWSNMQAKLRLAKNLSEEATQSQINYQLDQLTAAINQLKEASNSGGSNTPDTPDTPDTPETPDNSGATGGFNCEMGVGSEVYFISVLALIFGAYLVVRKIKRHNA